MLPIPELLGRKAYRCIWMETKTLVLALWLARPYSWGSFLPNPHWLSTVHASPGTLPSPISGGCTDLRPLGLKAASVLRLYPREMHQKCSAEDPKTYEDYTGLAE